MTQRTPSTRQVARNYFESLMLRAERNQRALAEARQFLALAAGDPGFDQLDARLRAEIERFLAEHGAPDNGEAPA